MYSEQSLPSLESFLNLLLKDEALQRQIQTLDGQDAARVAMGKAGGYPPSLMARQVAGRAIAKSKMLVWHADLRVAYPPRQNLGQASVHQAAALKASLLKGCSVADLTGGTGIDAWFMAQVATRFLYNEPDKELAQIARHNLGLLGLNLIDFSQKNAEDVWQDEAALVSYQAIYIDPSRLDEGRKVIGLSGYSPDIMGLPESIIKNKKLMVKLGPMLDLAEVMKVLPWVRQLLVVSVKNEVKELLALNWEGLPGATIQALELDWRGRCFRFSAPPPAGRTTLIPTMAGGTVTHLFEPGAALVKAGLVRPYGDWAGLRRLHPDVGLYFADITEPLFGKTYRIVDTLSGNPEEVRKRFAKTAVDVAAKGFTQTAEQLIARHKFKTGGGPMLYFTKMMEDGRERHVCFVLERVLS